MADASRRPQVVFAPWRASVAFARSAIAAVALVACALVFARPDLLVLATPLVIVTAWSAITRPDRHPTFRDRLGHDTLNEGDATQWHGHLTDATDVDTMSCTLIPAPWIERRPHRGSVTCSVVDGSAHASVGLRSTRWGRRSVAPTVVTVASPWGAFRSAATTFEQPLVTLPRPSLFDTSGPVRPTDGLVGSHRSVRPGEGSEFASIRPFHVGDRMRRINWTRSLRSQSLHVNATWADQDTHVALLVDASNDIGDSGGVDGAASSLDDAVRAAAAIAQHYVTRGDRVSLETFGERAPLALPAATGNVHLRRVLSSLTGLKPDGRAARSGRLDELSVRRSNSAQLTIVLSPLVDSLAIDLSARIASTGRSVVVVDTLPDDVAEDDDPVTNLAWRIRLLERRRETRAAQECGIAVVRWLGPGSLDQFLHDIARRSAAPRRSVR